MRGCTVLLSHLTLYTVIIINIPFRSTELLVYNDMLGNDRPLRILYSSDPLSYAQSTIP